MAQRLNRVVHLAKRLIVIVGLDFQLSKAAQVDFPFKGLFCDLSYHFILLVEYAQVDLAAL